MKYNMSYDDNYEMLAVSKEGLECELGNYIECAINKNSNHINAGKVTDSIIDDVIDSICWHAQRVVDINNMVAIDDASDLTTSLENELSKVYDTVKLLQSQVRECNYGMALRGLENLASEVLDIRIDLEEMEG